MLEVEHSQRTVRFADVQTAFVQVELNRPVEGGLSMDIDISVLRLMEREKDVPFEVLAKAIEEALLTAYERTEGAVPGARCSCTEDRARDRDGSGDGRGRPAGRRV